MEFVSLAMYVLKCSENGVIDFCHKNIRAQLMVRTRR